jgi:hypothetical protein
VTVGSPTDSTPQNNQSETAVAVDAAQPNILAAGANDTIDWRPCPPPQAAATQAGTCFDHSTPVDYGVGFSGVYFSFDRGHSWVQPTYTGLTARDCAATGPCPVHTGLTGTLPWYSENGLVSHGDPAVAFGPRPSNGRFSWANGARLYYSNNTVQLLGDRFFPVQEPFRGLDDIYVSRLDDPTPASVMDKSSWMAPVIATPRTSATTFEDKSQIWADNASSSPFFGNVYVCADEVRSLGQGQGFSLAQVVSTSTDGGDTWAKRQVDSAANNAAQGLREACSIRTDSNGVVYLFYTGFPFASHLGPQVMQKSFDGGKHWTRPQEIFEVSDECFNVDSLEAFGECIGDGLAGARIGISAAPSVDIANGAPTGDAATNEIVDAWSDGRNGLNDEKTLVALSTDGGTTWSDPATVSLAGDRPLYSAPAISPTGDRLYVVYEGPHAPWQGADMTTPRPYHGVFLTAPIGADGTPGAWSMAENGPLGDLRASYPGYDIYQERIGDYVYAAAATTYGAAVWTDVRNAAVCDPVQAWRTASNAAGARVPGAPWPLSDCPGTWGNTDIYAATTG